MTSKVFFAEGRASGRKSNKISKILRLLESAGVKDMIRQDDLTAIKVHFGEKGNDTFINPIFVRQVVDIVKAAGGKPFISDTNTLYKGSRHNSVDHLITALEHGFSYATVNAPLIIADGLISGNFSEIEIDCKHFDKVKIAEDIISADAMVVITHFKGHMLAGFGGAIKNLAMGCSTAKGKMEQHSTRPQVVTKTCTGCGECSENCPTDAIAIISKKAKINYSLCIGCGECLTVCPNRSMIMDWSTDKIEFVERMTEYALGAVKNKENKIIYISFLMNITPDCDCASWSDLPIVPDIGILASADPVALDKACLDLVNSEKGLVNSKLPDSHEEISDKFTAVHPDTRGILQIEYGEKIGLGNAAYDLIVLGG